MRHNQTPVYLASPLGFAESTKPYLAFLRDALRSLGLRLYDPWSSTENRTLAQRIRRATNISDRATRLAALARANSAIGANNERALRRCPLVIAVLDGVDVDSGTASEIGFAAALRHVIFGIRTDFRRSGENEASIVNPQVQWWIEQSGGHILGEIDQLLSSLRQRQLSDETP